ncbi:MAG: glycosyltransferase family 2 protein, partial [Propionibacterium sp.]|nr:glycosyltransferase family 2 protein [Propionibacterium sp.]
MDTAAETHVPEVSVIIACHNATKTLPLQLEALSRQEGAPAFEVILSDNRSKDALLSLVDAWRARLDLRYVWSGQVPGAAYARNVGMSIARADKWLFCDADDAVARDWISRGAAVLDLAPVFSG